MKSNRWKNLASLAAVVATCAMASLASAEAPAYLPIQGYLSDAAGEPIDGNVSITFRLYDNASDGNKIHEEAFPVVNVDNGYFTVYMGEIVPLDLSLFRDHTIVFLGVLVSGDSEELSPRLQLATAPYASYSKHAGDATTLEGQAASAFMRANATIPWSSVTGVPPTPTWDSLSGKPTTFPPSAHNHSASQITSGTLSASLFSASASLAAQCKWYTKEDCPETTGAGDIKADCVVRCPANTIPITGACDAIFHGVTAIADSRPFLSGSFPEAGPYDPKIFSGWLCKVNADATRGVAVAYALCCPSR